MRGVRLWWFACALLTVVSAGGCGAEGGKPSSRPGSTAGSGASGAGGAGGGAGSDFGNGAGAGGAAGSAGGSSGTGSVVPLDGCAGVQVDAKIDVKPGNLLVIFDRSLSMNEAFDTPTGPQPKFVAAGASLISALAPLACPATQDPDDPCVEALTVGAILFPTTADCILQAGAGVAPIESTENIDFKKVGEFIPAWEAYWMSHPLVFTTPIDAAFVQGDGAVRRTDLVGNKAVVLFTDGEPTCPLTPNAVSYAMQWAAEGVKTYVVGLPGANGVQTLRDIAAAGGTADYITPADSKVLEDALKQIIVETAGFDSCTFTIGGKIVDAQLACSSGVVKLDGNPIVCDPQDGFVVDDATHITFHGAACDALKASKGSLDAVFPCDVVVPQ
jgi:hypothetical protein